MSDRIDKGVRARETLHRLGVDTALDFHALPRSVVYGLVEEARAQKYRKPKNANGSTARYFHAKLMREARRIVFVHGRWV